MRKLRLFLFGTGFLVLFLWPAAAQAQEAEAADGDDAAEEVVAEEPAAEEAATESDAEPAAAAEEEPAVEAAGGGEAEPEPGPEPEGDPDAHMASDPAEPVLDEVFHDVDVSWCMEADGCYGPDFDEPFSEAGSSFSGTRDGEKAVLYRQDLDDVTFAVNGPETWVWDGVTESWMYVPGADQPGVRWFQAGAGTPYGDAGKALIYGGVDTPTADNFFADTWVLGDDYQWYQACNPCNPGPLASAAAANNTYHTLLFGGIDDTGTLNNNVWIWNGWDWDLVPVAGPAPDPRLGAGFAFDGLDFILFGGTGATDYGDTWALHFDHDTGVGYWELICAVCGPEPRFWSGFAGLYWNGDPWPGAILVGGYQTDPAQPLLGPGGGAIALSDQWAWDGYRWILTDPGIGKDVVSWFDPTTWDWGYPYSPKAASLPAIGAAVWTAGNCYYDEATEEYGCYRVTHQINLPPKGERVEVVAAGLPFTGHNATLRFLILAVLAMIAGAFMLAIPTWVARRSAIVKNS